MSAALHLSTLAVRQLVAGACAACAAPEGGEVVSEFLRARFHDHGQHLAGALAAASLKAWKALEVALAADVLRQRLAAQQVRAFLDAVHLPELPEGEPAFRRHCLADLHAAGAAGLLAGGKLKPRVLASAAADFARITKAEELREGEWALVGKIGDELRAAGHVHLGRLLALRPAQGEALLALAARYFFRRAVQGDAALAEALSFAYLERLPAAQERAFAALADALAQQPERIEEVLAEARAPAAAEGVLGIQEESEEPAAPSGQFDRDVLALLDEAGGEDDTAKDPLAGLDEAAAHDLREWKKAQHEDTAAAYEGYFRATFGLGKHVEEARRLAAQRRRQQEERQWKLAVGKGSVEGYEAYLEHWPNGQHGAEAKEWLAPALRALLLEDMANITLRRRYLTLRTAEQKELDESRPQLDTGEVAGTVLVAAVLSVLLGAGAGWLYGVMAGLQKFHVGPWLIGGAVLGVAGGVAFEVYAMNAAARRRALHAEMGPLPDGDYKTADEARRQFLGE
jgi:hypothetical protein